MFVELRTGERLNRRIGIELEMLIVNNLPIWMMHERLIGRTRLGIIVRHFKKYENNVAGRREIDSRNYQIRKPGARCGSARIYDK